MPTYEYLCQACGQRFDRFQKMSDPPLKRCPCCHRGTVKRQLGTGAGIIFKGSGFYSTDYRSASYRKAAKQEQASPAEPAKPATPKADANAASKGA